MNAKVYIANAFIKNNSGGNKAGVVIDELQNCSIALSANEKQEIAAEVGLSETVFISHSKKTDFKFEYFTPNKEIELCGHATIAAFATLNELGILNKSNYTIETLAGQFNIEISADGMIYMEQDLPKFYEIIDTCEVSNCFENIRIHPILPIQITSTGVKDIMLPIESPEILFNMKPDLNNITQLSISRNTVGIHAFSLISNSEITAICRNFAPLYGIDEESATGTSNCALACYLFKNGYKKETYQFEQGYNLDSVSQIFVKLKFSHDDILQVMVGGYGNISI